MSGRYRAARSRGRGSVLRRGVGPASRVPCPIHAPNVRKPPRAAMRRRRPRRGATPLSIRDQATSSDSARNRWRGLSRRRSRVRVAPVENILQITVFCCQRRRSRPPASRRPLRWFRTGDQPRAGHQKCCKRACSVAGLVLDEPPVLGHPAQIPRAHDRSASTVSSWWCLVRRGAEGGGKRGGGESPARRRLTRGCPVGSDGRWDRHRPRIHTRSRPTAEAGRTLPPAPPSAARTPTPAPPRCGRAG
jgi:hypothetical protein